MATIPPVSKAALQDWIEREAEPITVVDPTAVADYVLEQLEKAEGKEVESQRTALEKDLNTFFEAETPRFVSRLLAKVAPKPAAETGSATVATAASPAFRSPEARPTFKRADSTPANTPATTAAVSRAGPSPQDRDPAEPARREEAAPARRDRFDSEDRSRAALSSARRGDRDRPAMVGGDGSSGASSTVRGRPVASRSSVPARSAASAAPIAGVGPAAGASHMGHLGQVPQMGQMAPMAQMQQMQQMAQMHAAMQMQMQQAMQAQAAAAAAEERRLQQEKVAAAARQQQQQQQQQAASTPVTTPAKPGATGNPSAAAGVATPVTLQSAGGGWGDVMAVPSPATTAASATPGGPATTPTPRRRSTVIDRATAVLSAQETIMVELAQRVALHRRQVDKVRAAVAAAAGGGDAQLRAQVQDAIKATRALSEEQVRVMNTVSTAHKAAEAGLQRLQQRKQAGSSSATPGGAGTVASGGRRGRGDEDESDGEEPLLLGDDDDDDDDDAVTAAASDGEQGEQEALVAWKTAEAATAAQFADAGRAASVAQAAQDELAALQRRHDGADNTPVKAAPVLVQSTVQPEGGEAAEGGAVAE